MQIRVGIYDREMEIGVDVKVDLQQVTFIGSGLDHAKATRFEHYVKIFLFLLARGVTLVVVFGFLSQNFGGWLFSHYMTAV